jgi:hypothetical protein
MPLIPQIDLTIKTKCDKINVYEQTGPYIASTNAGGWGAPNVDTAAITAATVEIYDYTGNTLLDTITLTSVYATVAGAPTPGAFFAVEDHTWEQADGIYEVVYSVTAGGTTYTNATQHVLFTCNLENCMDDVRAKAVLACDSERLDELKTALDQLEVYRYGINADYSAGNFEDAISKLTSAQTICDGICDCGCGDC